MTQPDWRKLATLLDQQARLLTLSSHSWPEWMSEETRRAMAADATRCAEEIRSAKLT